PEERRRLQRAATEYGVTFQDMMNAGIDPSILFDVQTATTPKGPLTDSTVYQPGPINPATPGLDTAFRESPVRKRIPGTEEFDPLTGSPTGYRYTPAARLTPATGSGLSWTPPVVTSRPRQLLDVGGGYRPSYSQIYAQNRADQDRALMNAFRESGRPYNFAEYNYWRNRLRANDFGQGKIDEAKFRTEFDKWNSETKAPLTGDGGNPPAGGNPQAGTQNYGTYGYYSIDPVTGVPRYEQADTRIAGGPVTPKDIMLGGAYMFAEGGPVKKIEGVAEESATPETESRTMLQRLTGIGEAGLTAGTAMASSIPAGLKGIYDFAATPGSFYDRLKKATETIEGQTMATTYIPRTEAGQEYVQNLSALAAPSEYVRDKTLEQTNNPYMATAAEFVYDPLNLVPGMKTLGAVAPLLGKTTKSVVADVPRTSAKMLSALPSSNRPFYSQMDMRIADMGPQPRTKDQARAELSKNARANEVARLDNALAMIDSDKVT
ncbi:MAG: hypothetical protein EB075_13250, partial [Bacteroidetes bacterium]|nr:hypothetical protein [Bacteroidota bacterium]